MKTEKKVKSQKRKMKVVFKRFLRYVLSNKTIILFQISKGKF
jgi:hypothetical protein